MERAKAPWLTPMEEMRVEREGGGEGEVEGVDFFLMEVVYLGCDQRSRARGSGHVWFLIRFGRGGGVV